MTYNKKHLISKFEKLNFKKIHRQNLSILFNKTSLRELLLMEYTCVCVLHMMRKEYLKKKISTQYVRISGMHICHDLQFNSCFLFIITLWPPTFFRCLPVQVTFKEFWNEAFIIIVSSIPKLGSTDILSRNNLSNNWTVS